MPGGTRGPRSSIRLKTGTLRRWHAVCTPFLHAVPQTRPQSAPLSRTPPARNPIFTAIAAVSLRLGLGENMAIFSLLDQVLLRPLPVREPGRRVLLNQPGANGG